MTSSIVPVCKDLTNKMNTRLSRVAQYHQPSLSLSSLALPNRSSSLLRRLLLNISEEQYQQIKRSYIFFKLFPLSSLKCLLSMFDEWKWNIYNTNIRYFDVKAFTYHYDLDQISYQFSYSTKINLVQCTKQHWKGFDQVNFIYDLQSMLCPEIGTSAEIYGKYSSGKFKSINLQVAACDPSISSIPCATFIQVQQFWERMRGSTMFNFYYLNTIINSEYASYKYYYFEERDYGFIGPTLGCDVTLQLADYTVTADESIWPFADERIDNGIFFPQQTSTKYFPRTYDSQSYFKLQIIKSLDKYIFQRQVQKISTIFSYIGGIISSILTPFFVMKNYTSFSFEISIANQIFKQSRVLKSQQIKSSHAQASEVKSDINENKDNNQQMDNYLKMNIFLYNKYNFCQFFKNRLKNGPQWRDMQHINICHDQMTKQLDIKRIIKRIIFLEHCITRTIEADKIKDLIGSQPISPEQIKKNRIQLSQALQQDSSESDRSNIGQKVSGNNCQNDYDFGGEITAKHMMKKEGVKASTEEKQYEQNIQDLQALPPNILQREQMFQIFKATEKKSNRLNRLSQCMAVKDLTNIKPIDEEKLSQMQYDINVIPIEYCFQQKIEDLISILYYITIYASIQHYQSYKSSFETLQAVTIYKKLAESWRTSYFRIFVQFLTDKKTYDQMITYQSMKAVNFNQQR